MSIVTRARLCSETRRVKLGLRQDDLARSAGATRAWFFLVYCPFIR